MVHEKNWRVSLCVQELHHPRVQIQLDFVRHSCVVSMLTSKKDNLQLKIVHLFSGFSESVEACTDCASFLTCMTSCRSFVLSSVHSVIWFNEFGVPFGI